MPTLTVTAKGQVTLRKEILKHLGVAPGEKVAVEMQPGGRISVHAERPAGDISLVFGMLKGKGGQKLSIGEINDIISDSWAGNPRKAQK